MLSNSKKILNIYYYVIIFIILARENKYKIIIEIVKQISFTGIKNYEKMAKYSYWSGFNIHHHSWYMEIKARNTQKPTISLGRI